LQIQINNQRGGEALATTVTGMLEEALTRFSEHVTRLEVHITDENGKKGGKDDKRCVMEARMEGRKPMAVIENAPTAMQAVEGAIHKLLRMLDSTVGKQQEHRRNMPELPAD
jgi:Sigma 54 modulation protein / S30EA ribosomal protein